MTDPWNSGQIVIVCFYEKKKRKMFMSAMGR